MGRGLTAVALAAFVLLVAASPALATGGTSVEIAFRADHGLGVLLQSGTGANDPDRREGVTLTITEGRRYNLYAVFGKVVSSRGIDVSFGKLGRFRAGFRPTRTTEESKPPKGCRGEPGTTEEGWFVGEFRFRGERGYVHIDRTRVKGKMTIEPSSDCAKRAPIAADQKTDDATLSARLPGRRVFSAISFSAERPPAALFIGADADRREGMVIGRVAVAPSRGSRFRFDNQKGTATVRPPAPFRGRADFIHHPAGRNQWRGSLIAQLLGVGWVRLAGPRYRAGLKPEGLSFG